MGKGEEVKGGDIVKKVIRWIVLIWSVLAIPYGLDADIVTVFLGLLYMGLVIGLMISDLKESK